MCAVLVLNRHLIAHERLCCKRMEPLLSLLTSNNFSPLAKESEYDRPTLSQECRSREQYLEIEARVPHTSTTMTLTTPS